MNSTNSANCTRCGTPIPAGAADQLCPACLMSGAIADNGVNAETVEPGAYAHAPEETPPDPTEFPCELGGYRLLSLLGSGGMGSVYEAEQLATGRRVALKMLGQMLDSPDMRQRFLREGRLAASVNHPNSLYVFGTEEIGGRPVISMEIASGGTLNDILKKRGPLPVKEAVDTILDVIAGLEAALAGGVLHRDVKPSNCFVSPDGSVKVGDQPFPSIGSLDELQFNDDGSLDLYFGPKRPEGVPQSNWRRTVPGKGWFELFRHDVDTRCLLRNDQKIADRSSRMELLKNNDGSVTIYMGPDKPEGEKAKNWIPTVAGKAWFPYFRLYSPKKEFLDRTWILPDIEKAK